MVLIILTSLLNLLLGVIVVVKGPKRFINILFGVLAATTSFWGFNNFMIGVSQNPVFWLKGAYSWGGLVISSGLVWVLYLCNSKNIKWKALGIYILAAFFFIASYTDGLIIGKVEKVYLGRFDGTTGPLFALYSLFFFLVALVSALRLFWGVRESEGIKRSQLLIVAIGAYSYLFVSVMVSFILPLFGYLKLMSLDSPSSLFLVGSIAYAITRYRFMDIRAIILRSFTFSIIIFIITGFFSIITSVITYVFAELTDLQSNIVSGVILSFLVTVFYQPLHTIIERATNAFLYKKSYDPDVLISKINQIASSTLDFNHLLKSICVTLVEAFHSEKIGVVLLDKKEKLYVAYESGFAQGVTVKLTRGSEKIMLEQFRRTPETLVVEEMKTQYENGENVSKVVSPKLLTALHQEDVAVIVPLRLKDKLIGVVAIGTKKSGELYGTRDLRVLKLVSGQIAVSIENARLYDEQKRFAIVLKDEVEKATRELRAANLELKRLDASKSEFISIASHQLRTPLTIIKGFISMINEQAFGKVPPLIGKQLAKVYEANERLIGLVEDLLNISRIESGRQSYTWQSTDLFKLASEVVENIKSQAEQKGLRLILEKPEGRFPKPVADGDKLHEVMMNFVDNAIKYTATGEIHVQMATTPPGMITFVVRDSGMGLSRDTILNLFKKFSRGKGSALVHTEGTGLGLYVAKKIIDVHEGKIWAESRGEGKGSTFAFSVPIAGPKNRPQPVVRKVTIKTPEQLAREAKR
ncbi:MAG: ATP-binding protein [Patescibacteria group bacterium]|nr:ATP-binding protein [Patescibacteria group bacterium]